ncbi:hypothetical protein HERIO_172 [Hepatospora eriocheir]|uniref:Uncharacterized protein n=1 Tax=Hepatospora eriocheir TaxID=1081669 RepID=A0A1X0QE21_9MICR|nr:hypothetical protein HERIO_172 [Hepatospora eriocheir]
MILNYLSKNIYSINKMETLVVALCILLIIYRNFHYIKSIFYCKKNEDNSFKQRKVFFVGKRGSCKKLAILNLLKRQRHSDLSINITRDNVFTSDKAEKYKMLTNNENESYKVLDLKINNLKFIKYTPSRIGPNTLNKLKINTRDTFIFFLSDKDETYPMLAGFDVHFVYWKKIDDKYRDDVTYLDENTSKLLEIIYKIKK